MSKIDHGRSKIEGAWQPLCQFHRTNCSFKVVASIRIAQLIQRCTKRNKRHQDALQRLLNCQTQVTHMMEYIQTSSEEIEEEGKTLAGERTMAQNEATDQVDQASDASMPRVNLEESKSPTADDVKARQFGLQSRLRECQVIRHKIFFLLGDLHHTIGNDKEEEGAYAEADALRQQLLKGTLADIKQNTRKPYVIYQSLNKPLFGQWTFLPRIASAINLIQNGRCNSNAAVRAVRNRIAG